MWLSPANVMLVVAGVDAADAALLAASFPAFEKWLSLSPSQLGILMMLQTGSGCFMLPVWCWALRRAGYKRLLMWAVSIWAVSTLATAHAGSFLLQCVLRIVNGGSLSCVMPLAQALLAETTPINERGSAFGTFACVERLCGMAVTYAVLASGTSWRIWYYIVFAATLALVRLLYVGLPPGDFGRASSSKRSYADSIRAILTIPSFAALVAQGIVGATPWRAMAFLNLLWISSGYKNTEAASIGAFSQLGAVFGAIIGGRIGDYAARRWPNSGRIAVAQLSVFAAVPLWVMWLSVRGPGTVYIAIGFGFAFYLVASWAGVAACRPICAELVEDAGDRANIVALWTFIEGAASAVIGGPIVGGLTELYGYRLENHGSISTVENANALRRALTHTGALFWGICFALWTILYVTFPRDRDRTRTWYDKV